jgi:DNA replication protein DnaC
MSCETSNETEKHGEVEYECSACLDKELIFFIDVEGYSMARPCECRERKAWKRRFKNALIPSEFTNSTFELFKANSSIQKNMLDLSLEYLEAFPKTPLELKKQGMANFGLIAVVGEQRIRSMPDTSKTKMKNEHNNFGIGKTHLQIALSKRLIKQGFNILVISDVTFMDEMMNAKRMDDNGETYYKMYESVLKADVLVWDDIGKAKVTEAKESLYYNIINERYKQRKPIVFNTNEDRGTLAERIGYAAQSRLIGTCYDSEIEKDYLLETEGIDWRLKKNA